MTDLASGPGTSTGERVGFTLNGQPVTVAANHPHLLAALREELHVTSVKDGCSPTGQCGCCTVHLDGKAQVSCQISLEKVADREVLTLEGVEEPERQTYADAFSSCGGLQCGFCIPGIVMRAKSQVDKKGSALTADAMSRHLGGNLCRCTGYVKVLEAIETVAKQADTAETSDLGQPVILERAGTVGGRGVKYEASELALGDRDYVDDIRSHQGQSLDGMLHASLYLTDHARADISAVDTAAALAAEGVVAVYTAADIPGDLKVGIIHTDWPVMIPVGGRTSYAGDVLAIVVADSRINSRAAVELVEVDYDVLVPFTDPKLALASDEDAVWGLDGNTLSLTEFSRGDVGDVLSASAHVVHETFHTQRIEHAFLEPESTLAVPSGRSGSDGRSLHVYSGGQGMWDDRNQIAAVLAIGHDQIVVELVSNGGAFGGKEDMSNQAHTALAAWLTGQPVKCTLSREESFRMHAKRHPIEMEVWAGCDEQGNLTGLRFHAIGDSGPYASVGMKVLERAAGHASGPYRWDAVEVEAVAVRTNNPVCGAFRGFGANQAQFATEGCLDRLAEKAGISGWDIRKRNVVHPGDVWGPGQIMDDGCLGAEACLDQIKPHYDAAIEAGEAVGLALGLKNSGLGNGFKEFSKACIRFEEDGTVSVWHGWTEMGQGVHTVALQVAAQELQIDPNRITVQVDTRRELGLGQTTGSRGTLMGAGSVKAAAELAMAGGCELGVDYVGEYRVDWTTKLGDPDVETPLIHSTFSYASQMMIANRDTGTIERVVAVHDVGKAVNPLLCEGQVEGAVHMGLGYALSEEFPTDPETAFPVNMTLRSLDIIRAKDVPEIEVILVEAPQPDSPYGIKGVGEIGLVPTAPAVASALRAVDGRWRTILPLKNDIASE